MFSQRASSAWQGAQPQKLTASMLLPGTSSASEWQDLLQSRRQFWSILTTRHASLVPVSAKALQRERRQMQAKHLWYNLNIRWVDLEEKLEESLSLAAGHLDHPTEVPRTHLAHNWRTTPSHSLLLGKLQVQNKFLQSKTTL